MIGNKLANEDKLENMVEELLREGYGLENYSNGNNKKGRVYANRFEMSGFKLKEYLSNYSLITQTIIGKAWDWVILQEQSEIPGFYDLENMEEEYFSDSVDSIQVMNTMISRSNHGNAQTVLLMTWGHRDGDDRNAKIYPNYIEMQRRITTGYYKYFAEVSSDRRPVKIIPAGLAFQKQYQDNIDVFNALYDTDGRHLTPQGMYLVACVIYDTITGKQTQGMTWKPVAITEAMRDQYQTLADTTVASFDDQYLRALPKAAGTEENGKKEKKEYVSSTKNNDKKDGHFFVIFLALTICCGGMAWVVLLQGRGANTTHIGFSPLSMRNDDAVIELNDIKTALPPSRY